MCDIVSKLFTNLFLLGGINQNYLVSHLYLYRDIHDHEIHHHDFLSMARNIKSNCLLTMQISNANYHYHFCPASKEYQLQ